MTPLRVELANQQHFRAMSFEEWLAGGTGVRGALDPSLPNIVTLAVYNRGKEPCDELHWSLLMPAALDSHVQVSEASVVQPLEALATRVTVGSATYLELTGEHESMLDAGEHVEIVTLHVVPNDETASFTAKWRITSANGSTPSTGYADLEFTRQESGAYAAAGSIPS